MQEGELECSAVPALVVARNRTVASASLTGCGAVPAGCVLARFGANGARALLLVDPRAPLRPAHVTGLHDLRLLAMFEAGTSLAG
jgi:hypothetical protein